MFTEKEGFTYRVCVGVYLAMNFTRGQVNTENSQVLREENVSEKR